MLQANYKDTRITLTEVVHESFFVVNFNKFLFPGVLSKATNPKNFDKELYLNVQEFSRKYICFLIKKTVICAVYSENLKLYEKRLQQKNLLH